MPTLIKTVASALLLCLLLPANVAAQTTFDQVEGRSGYGLAEEGDKGKLLIDRNSIRFVKRNEQDEYFSIPSDAVEQLVYSRVAGRRVKTAIFITGPLGLFLKGKKHYLTLSFDDGEDIVGAVEFKLDKNNYRGILRAVEQVTGTTLEFDQEGIKGEEETVASRDDSRSNVAILDISSEPRNAEIEIDGVFAGTTPRSKKLDPGEYKIKITMRDYESWERKVTVEAGEEFPLSVQLEQK
jgi:hypothetical protein